METHPSFDPEETSIVENLVPEGAEPGSPAGNTPADDPATPPVTPAPTASPTPSPEPTPQPTPAPADGNVKGALRASRRQEKRLRDELDRLKQENEALKQGKSVDASESELTDEDLATLREDFPAQYKALMETRRLKQELESRQPPGAAPEDWEPPSYPPEVQEVIDQVPQLLDWQHDKASQHKFERAVAYDAALFKDPDWQGRPAAERFAEAARRAQAALEAPPQATAAPSAAPAASRTDPALALAGAPLDGPKGISDFRGGGPADAPSINYQRMSDEDILASLPVSD